MNTMCSGGAPLKASAEVLSSHSPASTRTTQVSAEGWQAALSVASPRPSSHGSSLCFCEDTFGQKHYFSFSAQPEFKFILKA